MHRRNVDKAARIDVLDQVIDESNALRRLMAHKRPGNRALIVQVAFVFEALKFRRGQAGGEEIVTGAGVGSEVFALVV